MAELQIENTSMWLDVRDVLGMGKKPVKFEYRGMLHTEKEDLPVMKILSIDTVRDYANVIGDHIHLVFKMPLGDYAARLYPFRENLEFSIKRITLKEGGDGMETNTKIVVERYKAVFLIDENRIISASEAERTDTASLNLVDILDVKLQLLDRSLEPIRIKTVSGVYKNVTQKQLIQSLLGGESLKITVDGKPSVDGLDLVEPDNSETRKHVIFPDGSLITNIPTYLQEMQGGVYNSGIGTYLQRYNDKKIWFIYPLFNFKRFDESKDDRVIIYAVPSDKYSGSDRTYIKDGNILKIVATSEKKYQDTADVDYMNKGSGFKLTDARAFMKKPVKLTAAGPIGARKNLNTEVVIYERKDGLNHAPMLQGAASSNPFKEYSRVNARNNARIDLIWENANFDLLYPGMPCKYVFLDNDKVIELKGTIVFVHAVTALQGQAAIATVYKNVCAITLLTETRKVTRKLPKTITPGVF